MISRSVLISLVLLLSHISLLQVYAAPRSSTDCSSSDKIDRELRVKLSAKASVVHYTSAAPRYSDYYAPHPGTIVNVAEENDVAETVKYCVKNNLQFLAQSGGHGWATTFNIGKNDVIINMRGLNKVTVSKDKKTVTMGGGTLVGELVDEAYKNQVTVVTPTCNCVGIMGAMLGAGFAYLTGKYGLAMDSLLSVNLVTAEGKLITVSSTSYPDLWWALRGAGANFGIVTSAILKAHPPINGDNSAWKASLVYTPDKLEAVVQILNDLDYDDKVKSEMYWAALPPNYIPTIIVPIWYFGPDAEAEGRAAFKALFDLEPIASPSGYLPYNEWNAGGDAYCGKGGRKPGYGVYMNKMDPRGFREAWDEYVSFMGKDPSFNNTILLFDAHSTEISSQFDSASDAHNMKFAALLMQSYEDAKFDSLVRESGQKIRAAFTKYSGFDELKTYINYAYGDESLEAIYGESLPRLKVLKKVWDKHRRFSQWFPIPPSK